MPLGTDEQYSALSFVVFQEDLLEVAVHEDAQRTVEEVESQLICNELNVELNEKPEANLPFSTTFEFIWAELITADPAAIIH